MKNTSQPTRSTRSPRPRSTTFAAATTGSNGTSPMTPTRAKANSPYLPSTPSRSVRSPSKHSQTIPLTHPAARPGTKAFEKGSYHGPGLPPKHSILSYLPKEELQHPVCDSDTLSMSWPFANLIIFCPALLTGVPKPGLLGKTSGPAPWSIDQIHPTSDSSLIKSSTSLDSAGNTIALQWLHELGHLVMKCTNPPSPTHNCTSS